MLITFHSMEITRPIKPNTIVLVPPIWENAVEVGMLFLEEELGRSAWPEPGVA